MSITIETHDDITALLEKIAQESSGGNGCLYELYVRKFSHAVDGAVRKLPEERRKMVIEIARKHYDYINKEEEEEEDRQNREAGRCCHGLDEMTCPCGCFEY